MIYPYKGKLPKIDPTAFIADSAVIIGDVTIGKYASIWPNTVVRGDDEAITIGDYVNVQDNSTLHCDAGMPLVIGDYCLIGHNAIVNCGHLIGMGAILLAAADIGEESIIGAGSLVTQNKKIPARSMAFGSPAKVVRQISDEEAAGIRKDVLEYADNGQIYKEMKG